MKKHLKLWLDILGGMANENTYKLAWGRGVIECVLKGEYQGNSDYVEISFSSISERILKYYLK